MEELKRKAIEAIRDVHGETSVSLHVTHGVLEDLRDLVAELIDAVEDDIRAEETA